MIKIWLLNHFGTVTPCECERSGCGHFFVELGRWRHAIYFRFNSFYAFCSPCGTSWTHVSKRLEKQIKKLEAS